MEINNIIGGEFGIEKNLIVNNAFYDKKNNFCFSSGRASLFYILKHLLENNGGGGIFIPDFLCDSIIKTIKIANFKFKFYHVYEDFSIDIDYIIKNAKNNDAILLINYFGICNYRNIIKQLKMHNNNFITIEDNVQSFFNSHSKYTDYTFNSIRKWFPCPDGSSLFFKNKLIHSDLKTINIWARFKFLGNYLKFNSKYEYDDKYILKLLDSGEKCLEKNFFSNSSLISKIIYNNINFNNVAIIRKRNSKYLHNELVKLRINHLYNNNTVPMVIPIFIKHRDKVRKFLFKYKIFTPIHWPNNMNLDNKLYKYELSLICDQRYNINHMKKQIYILNKAMSYYN